MARTYHRDNRGRFAGRGGSRIRANPKAPRLARQVDGTSAPKGTISGNKRGRAMNRMAKQMAPFIPAGYSGLRKEIPSDRQNRLLRASSRATDRSWKAGKGRLQIERPRSNQRTLVNRFRQETVVVTGPRTDALRVAGTRVRTGNRPRQIAGRQVVVGNRSNRPKAPKRLRIERYDNVSGASRLGNRRIVTRRIPSRRRR